MTRLQKFIKNILLSIVNQVTLILSGFITVKVILDNYGSEINGFINSVNQFLVYFKLVEGGLAAAVVYALYKPLAEKDILERNRILTAAKTLYIQSGHFFLGLLILLATIYPLFISLSNKTYGQMFFLILIIGFSGILEFYTLAKYRVLLTADQKNYVISFASTVYLIFYTLTICILAYYNIAFEIMWFFASLTILFRTLILMIYTKYRYKKLSYNEKKPNYDSLSQKWASLYNQILGAIQLGAPILLLTIFTQDFTLISIYVVYNLVINGINGVLGIFKSGIYSGFGDLLQQKKYDVFKKAFNEFEFAYQSIIIILFTSTFLLLNPFISIYTMGNEVNYISESLALLFVINAILYNIKVPQGMLIYSAGKFKETKKQVTIQALIIILLGLVLTPIYDIEGVLVASIFSNLYRVIDMGIYVPKHISKLSIAKTFFNYFKTISTIAIGVFILKNLIYVNSVSYIEWMIDGIVVVILSTLGVIINIILFDKKYFWGLVSRFKKVRKFVN